MKKAILTIALLLFIHSGLSNFAFAAQGDLSLSTKELIERLTRLEEGQKSLGARIDDLSKRIDDVNERIDDVNGRFDTVLMNPPFGAQKSNQKADRKFIEKGFEIAPVLYSIHLTKTIHFINKLVYSLDGKISYSKNYIFPIKYMFGFHEKKLVNYDVILLRIITNL